MVSYSFQGKRLILVVGYILYSPFLVYLLHIIITKQCHTWATGFLLRCGLLYCCCGGGCLITCCWGGDGCLTTCCCLVVYCGCCVLCIWCSGDGVGLPCLQLQLIYYCEIMLYWNYIILKLYYTRAFFFQSLIGHEIRTIVIMRWNFAQCL